MRALLTPDVAPRAGIVVFKPGRELLPMFSGGRRVLISSEPEFMRVLPSGLVSDADQPLADDPALAPFFSSQQVIAAAGGRDNLAHWVQELAHCQWSGGDGYNSQYHTVLRTEESAVCLCEHHDNQLRETTLSRLDELGRVNAAQWVINSARIDLALPEGHQLTLPELCWWATLRNVIQQMPDAPARRVLKLPAAVVETGTLKEAAIHPMRVATEIIQEAAKQVLELRIDPETPETFLLRPKRRRWINEKYTRWVKSQPCLCCGKPADDPHHLIGYGQGGTGTKAHDLFVIPLCRAHHDALHADMRAFEAKYGTQPELLLRMLDRALALGVIATGKNNRGD
ncbi:hypothetical protein NG99_23660 [Erwinia typographi]|uniref:HNH nuclease domain-containing protein n=1 Tax=Erwinia typographi TaxID=371042 RepID=A0A0A3YNW4_9GAMM|nr:DUF968 domain-containing protein [Erwinia typographi]KGT87224.1 hypothetical protein NG99_23660 [Erwinia typographi]